MKRNMSSLADPFHRINSPFFIMDPSYYVHEHRAASPCISVAKGKMDMVLSDVVELVLFFKKEKPAGSQKYSHLPGLRVLGDRRGGPLTRWKRGLGLYVIWRMWTCT